MAALKTRLTDDNVTTFLEAVSDPLPIVLWALNEIGD
jgi:hypothetical protein